jgi:hypothetical protein
MCECINDRNKILGETGFSIPVDFSNRALLHLTKIKENGRSQVARMSTKFCPFCGHEYEENSNANIVDTH